MFLFEHDDVDLWGPPPVYPQPEGPFLCLSNRFDLHAKISPEDEEWARQWLWGYRYAAGVKASFDKLYATRVTTVKGKPVNIYLHKEICLRAHGKPPSRRYTMADHIDGDSLNCQRGNLRWATPSMNSKNKFGALAERIQKDIQNAPDL